MNAEPGTVFYVSVGGSGDCSTPTTTCELATALGKLGSNAIIDIMDNGPYSGTSLSLASGTLVMFVNSGSATLSNIPISVTNSASLTLDSLTITNTTGDGIDCTNATLAAEQVYVLSNGSNGINASSCTLTVERSRIGSNTESGIYANDSTVTIDNNFVYGNNVKASNSYAGVLLTGSTSGIVRFNSIAYNGYNNGNRTNANVGGGLSCQAGNLDATDNLVIGNNTQQDQSYLDISFDMQTCQLRYVTDGFQTDLTLTTADLPGGGGGRHPQPAQPGEAMLISQSDLHLTSSTPLGLILDNTNIVAGGATGCASFKDIDGEARPKVACDVGADECYTCGSNR